MINWSVALEMTGGDEMLLAQVIGAFQEETPTLMANIREAISKRDTTLLHRAAHTLKTSLWSLGATVSGNTAFALEQLAGDGRLDEVDALCAALESQMPPIYAELDRYVREKHGTG